MSMMVDNAKVKFPSRPVRKIGNICFFPFLQNNKRFIQVKTYCIISVYKPISLEEVIMAILYAGENVRHNKRAEWGIGKIIAVDKCGTIKVIFEGTKEVSIAKGLKYLIKVEGGGIK
jgi:hypothetical protein